MKIAVFAVGRMKAGPEKEIADRYFERFARVGPALGLEFSGISEQAESRARDAAERKRDEAERLAAYVPGAALAVLDERGKDLSSADFSARIASLRDGGQRALVFVIGGPDGHDPAVRGRADWVLSFGAATWPHQLVRIMLAEQLYRAATILSGHPYHRA
jgi:23S rRNA (pseudouridine1915-N3)-methyltransferase